MNIKTRIIASVTVLALVLAPLNLQFHKDNLFQNPVTTSQAHAAAPVIVMGGVAITAEMLALTATLLVTVYYCYQNNQSLTYDSVIGQSLQRLSGWNRMLFNVIVGLSKERLMSTMQTTFSYLMKYGTPHQQVWVISTVYQTMGYKGLEMMGLIVAQVTLKDVYDGEQLTGDLNGNTALLGWIGILNMYWKNGCKPDPDETFKKLYDILKEKISYLMSRLRESLSTPEYHGGEYGRLFQDYPKSGPTNPRDELYRNIKKQFDGGKNCPDDDDFLLQSLAQKK